MSCWTGAGAFASFTRVCVNGGVAAIGFKNGVALTRRTLMAVSGARNFRSYKGGIMTQAELLDKGEFTAAKIKRFGKRVRLFSTEATIKKGQEKSKEPCVKEAADGCPVGAIKL